MKRCSKCGEEKALGEFHKRKASKDGLAPICRACKAAIEKARHAQNPEAGRRRAREWKAQNRAYVAERERQRRLDNLEEFRAKGREYAAADKAGAKRRMNKWLADPANQERKRQKDKEWRERNRERKAALDKAWAEANPERRREIVNRYREAHPEVMRVRRHLRGARERGAAKPNAETRDFILILEGDPCCYCGGAMEHIDHITPLTKGGTGEWDNLTAACGSCNQRKSAKPMLHFLLEGSSGGVEPPLDLAA